MRNGQAFGCGQCLPCRLKNRRTWTHRLMLEAGLQADNAFVTLTYKEPQIHEETGQEYTPEHVEYRHHRRFMDALRKRISPLRIRFYMVAEYGDEGGRPHYHYILFGYPSCKGKHPKYRCCSACDPIEEVWGKGLISNDPVEIGTCRYVAKYVVKKMTRRDDPRLSNREPEFAKMSNRPGIGHGALKRVAHIIARYDLLTPEGDVPVTLRHGKTMWPLGRYLRKQLRKELGLSQYAPQSLSPEASYKAFIENQEMRTLQSAAIADPENPGLKYHLQQATQGKREQIKKRLQMYLGKKGKL